MKQKYLEEFFQKWPLLSPFVVCVDIFWEGGEGTDVTLKWTVIYLASKWQKTYFSMCR